MPDELNTTLESILTPIEETPATEAAPATDAPATPSPYEGKSIEDVIAIAEQREQSYNELRSLQGRQANELGEVRRLADSLIQADVTKRTTEEAPKPVELNLDDPDEASAAIQRMVDARVEQALQGVQGQVQNLGRATFEQQMDNAHADWRTLSTTQEMLDWVGSSPVRTEMYKKASTGDFAYADELLSTYKTMNPTAAPADTAAAAEQQADKLRSATLETGATAPTAGGAKPTYRRTDIMHLRMTDPVTYNRKRSDIDLAYKEGRVK